MKLPIKRTLFSLSAAVLAGAAACTKPTPMGKSAAAFLGMKSVPDTNFLANLELNGQQMKANFDVKDNFARCIATSDPRLNGLQGQFLLIGNGVFMISLANEQHRASQFWVFQEDGSATIKEIPDRGERQRALPAAADSL